VGNSSMTRRLWKDRRSLGTVRESRSRIGPKFTTLLMLIFLIFGIVLSLMIWLLLDPSSLLNLLRSSIQPEARSAPPRYPYFAMIVIFGTVVGVFYELRRSGILHPGYPNNAFQFYSLVFVTVFMGANAIGACYWPILFQRVYNPRLRHVRDDDLSPKAKRLLDVTGKCWGVLFILTFSYLVYTLNSR